ncbi:rhodanese-like domain-containing protein [Sulfurospirillum barnesii]|uniref:Rhodanese-related sulfurtransferase n=1 Tax=Sulfurospirillum barnesii (strain ATCC 700032 / DSM 10660 / SES-3) TaxID=760154 RepID=I3XX56_SULBS|nr:rhodanese-like domain-containing protein [Sulfurospirillum barnesii]AFL68530.1 Rhodanese-related sulfurtransferase [Sulfurospirillum barnesii SES-3]
MDLPDEWSEEALMNLVQTLTKSLEVTPETLHVMLNLRAQGKLNFLLVDIREIYEYTQLSIKGTDLLLPTSTIHLHMEQLKKLHGTLLIFYCRSANRTLQLLHILKRMGFSNIAHLHGGIIEYKGEKIKNAPLPKNIRTEGK